MCCQQQGRHVMTNNISKYKNCHVRYSKQKKAFLFWLKKTKEVLSLRRWERHLFWMSRFFWWTQTHMAGFSAMLKRSPKMQGLLGDVLLWIMGVESEYPLHLFIFFYSLLLAKTKRCFGSSTESQLILQKGNVCLDHHKKQKCMNIHIRGREYFGIPLFLFFGFLFWKISDSQKRQKK